MLLTLFIIGNVQWFEESTSVILTSPNVEQCNKVMSQLKSQKHTGKHWEIIIQSSTPDSLLTVLNNINECLVSKLDIEDTPLKDSYHCVSKLSHVLTHNNTLKELLLRSSPLSPNSLKTITEALTANTTLKSLAVFNDDTITDKDIPYICDAISANKTLEVLSISSSKITEVSRKQLSKALDSNKTLTKLVVNDNFLRFII